MTKSIEEKEYRCGSLIAAAKGNVPLTAIKYFAEWANPYAKMLVGDVKKLMNSYISMVMETLIDNIKTILHEGSFDEFSITFDGTPAFAEAEAVVIRVVTKDYHVLELLVQCNLFDKKLNGSELGNHIIKTIIDRCGKELKDLIAAQQDRASTNKGALNTIEEKIANVKICKNYCSSHTTSNSGKQMIGGKNSVAKYAEDFRQKFQKMIQYPGSKARKYTSKVFKEPVRDGSGVRFFVKFEQLAQMTEQGLDKIMSQVLPICKENGWSEESTKKMLIAYGTEEKAAHLGMAMIEIAAVVDYGKVFAETCYTLEGDSAVILRGSAVFKRLEDTIGRECELERVHKIVDDAFALIKSARDRVTLKMDMDVTVCNDAQNKVNTKKDSLETLLLDKNNIQGGTSSSGRRRQFTARATNQDALEHINNQIIEAKVELRVLKKEHADLEKIKDEAIEELQKWTEKFPYLSTDSLIDHAKSIGQPAIDYYNKVYNTEAGDCYNVRQMVDASQIFNPIFLKGKSDTEIVTVLHPLVDKLIHFGYPQFTEDFLNQMKKEIPKLLNEVNRHHDLDEIKPSKLFKTRMQKRIKKKKLPPNTILDWKKDDGEYSCRIWEWWRIRMIDLPCFGLALRLVVLCQLSSCSVERVFSRLKLIQDVCGTNMLQDHLEMRLFLQCNGDMQEMMNTIQKYTRGE